MASELTVSRSLDVEFVTGYVVTLGLEGIVEPSTEFTKMWFSNGCSWSTSVSSWFSFEDSDLNDGNMITG